jgi:hypothetical protein
MGRKYYSFSKLLVFFFSSLFFLFSFAIALLALREFWTDISGVESMTGAFVKAINSIVIAVATFELGSVVGKEYGGDDKDNIVVVLRRTLPRFVSITCIALALEGLLLVIKYSQLELAGNLYYPVAIICAASFLLIALGVFLRFSLVPEAESIHTPHADHPDTFAAKKTMPHTSHTPVQPNLHYSKTLV